MAMSDQALQALEAAVRLNPDGARQLYAVLRTATTAVKRKPTDPFGPLAMMVVETGPRRSARSALGVLSRPALPPDLHPQARRFRREWLKKQITKAALAEAIETCLHRDGQPVPEVAGPWHRIRQKGSGP
jgi:hypothetical protein